MPIYLPIKDLGIQKVRKGLETLQFCNKSRYMRNQSRNKPKKQSLIRVSRKKSKSSKMRRLKDQKVTNSVVLECTPDSQGLIMRMKIIQPMIQKTNYKTAKIDNLLSS